LPITDQHRRKRAKNWLLFGVLVALAAALFGLSFIRVSEQPPIPENLSAEEMQQLILRRAQP
jgi:hypothetical protein